MKVLVVHNYYQQPGGEDATCEQECQLLERRGHQVVFYRRSNQEIEGLNGWQRLRLSADTIWNERSRREFLGLLARERPDVVHVHNTFVVISPSIFSACQEAGVPVVQTVQNYRLFCPAATFFRDGKICEECVEHGLFRSVRYACYHKSRSATAVVALLIAVNRRRKTWPGKVDHIIAVTQFSRKKMVEAGLPAEQVMVKPNFVYPDPGEGQERRDYALFAGRLSPEKRVNTLLVAWSKLSEPVPLLIAGGGPLQEALEEQARRSQLSNIQFLGQIPRAKTIAAMQSARFVVFPSEWYEGFPLTICEAFACGTPVICSRLGAMEEVVDHGRTGFHFTPGNAAELAERAAWAWNHPEEMRVMGREARREFEAKYTAESNYPLLIDIYERARARRRGGRAPETVALMS
ncbi:MAG TPA: glycosyltransferase family 4 protein [Terriglobia bacterium]